MSAQGTILVSQQDDGAMVDAYVDALLAMPLAPSPAPATPRQAHGSGDMAVDATAEDAPEVEVAIEVEVEVAAAVAVEDEVEDEVEAAIGIDDDAEAVVEIEREDEAAAAPTTVELVEDDAPLVGDVSGDATTEATTEAAAEADLAWPADDEPTPAPAAPPVRAAPAVAQPVPGDADEEDEDPHTHAAPLGQRWLRVAIGDDRYAVELLRVQEVVRLAPVIAVRGAVPSLLGVMNLRGRVVPVHDLGSWLRRQPVEPDERARIVVLEYQDELVGLMVSAVTDVVTLDAPQIEPPTPGLRDRIGMGIARTPGAPPTVLLDARVVFD